MKIIAIQVIPVIVVPDYNGCHDVTAQLGGPNEDTTGWAVYLRKEDGTVEWYADTGNETRAMIIGALLMERCEVPIEPQPWNKEK